jgi:hypothetical protein
MWQFNKDTVIAWYYQDGDEFNGNSVNIDYWSFAGSARSLYMNKEQQYYTDGKNHVVNNGTLKLIAKKDSVFKRTVDWMNDNDSLIGNGKFYSLNKKQYNYTSGKLMTKKTYTRGFFECRFKLSAAKGYWPAFWLYGGTPYEEIDIMECKSERESQIHLDIHCSQRCDDINYYLQKRSYGGWLKTKTNFSGEFSVVAGEWNEDEIKFYLNGECIGVSKVKFGKAKNVILNLAIPADDGPFNPGPDRGSNDDFVYEVDYVRIWGKDVPEKKNKKYNQDLQTSIEVNKPLLTSSKIKSKSKLVYGKKSDHQDDGVMISFFEYKDHIQLQTLGVFKNEVPAFKIIDEQNNEVQSGNIDSQIFNVEKKALNPNAEYNLVLMYQGKSVVRKLSAKP